MARTTASPIANDHFKRRTEAWLWVSISAAVFVHFLVFALWPDMIAHVDVPEAREATRLVNAVPRVDMPDRPASLQRPAIPVAGTPSVSFDATIVPSLPPLDLEVGLAPPSPTNPPANTSARAFTPFTIAPVLRNEREIVRVLQREYPSLLKASEIGGVVVVWAYVALNGRVQDVEVGETSGYESMDAAALKVAREMVFTPAQNRDKPVPVWVSLPITFRVARDLPTSPNGTTMGG